MKRIIQNIFSIKNENVHKVITIFGIKLKFLNNKLLCTKLNKQQKILDDIYKIKVSSCTNNVSEQYNIEGENNKIIIVEEDGSENYYDNINIIYGLKIEIHGNNNTVKLHKPFGLFNNLFIDIGNDNTYIEIHKECIIENFHFKLKFGINQSCIIGQGTTMYGGAIVLDEDSSIKIGNNCLFAGATEIWASDGHSIYDVTTKKLLNRVKKGIIIGDHCWFGSRVSILKNTTIASNTIIGQSSVVTGEYMVSNTVLAGNPARVIKHNVNWDAISPLYF